MKLMLFYALIPGLTSTMYGQENLKADLKEEVDSIESTYILDHKKQLNIKLETGNDVSTFNLIQDNREYKLKPNLNLRYAFVLSYKFLSFRIGVRSRVSESDKMKKGNSDNFRFRVKMLFDHWNHVIEYNIDKGYYMTNTPSYIIPENGNYLLFPSLKSNVLLLSSSYKFNDQYSLRAIQSQTEIQAKSAGTFAPGVRLSVYNLTGTDHFRNPSGEDIYQSEYNEYDGINLSLTAGYFYTFVLKKYWYMNAFVLPSAGIDFYKTKYHSETGVESRSYKESFLSLSSGIGGGYNSRSIFFGAEFHNQITNEKLSSAEVQILPAQNRFSVFIGYRFKPPKPIREPVDLIEKKVPLLQRN